MSTKDLSHTVIEGGRAGYNKWERRNSHSEHRFDEKMYLKEVTHDPENWYDYDIEPLRHVGKSFDDKLSPVYRWLHAQVGRPWNEVRSEVSEKFDTRTTAGRHIVHDHLLGNVEEVQEIGKYGNYGPEDPTTSYYKNQFYVDDNGLLQTKTRIKRQYHYTAPPQYNTNQIANWLSGRIIGKVGKKLFWFIPADKNKKRGGVSRTWKTIWGWQEKGWSGKYYTTGGLAFVYRNEHPIYKLDEYKNKIMGDNGKYVVIGYETTWPRSYPSSFRQGNKLSNQEIVYFNKLPEYYQNRILEQSPTNPNPVRPNYYSYYR